MKRNNLLSELKDFDDIQLTPAKSTSALIKIHYEQLIQKQSQTIKNLYRQCLSLRSIVNKLKSEQLFNIQKNSNPENVDIEKLTNIVQKALFKQIAEILDIKAQEISKTKIMQTIKKIQWERCKKIEPIFIERIKQIKVPVPVEIIVEKQVIKYIEAENKKDSGKPSLKDLKGQPEISQNHKNQKVQQQIVNKNSENDHLMKRRYSQEVINKKNIKIQEKTNKKEYQFFRPEKNHSYKSQRDFDDRKSNRVQKKDNDYRKKQMNQTYANNYSNKNKGFNSSHNYHSNSRDQVYVQDILDQQENGYVMKKDRSYNNLHENNNSRRSPKYNQASKHLRNEGKYQFDKSKFQQKKDNFGKLNSNKTFKKRDNAGYGFNGRSHYRDQNYQRQNNNESYYRNQYDHYQQDQYQQDYNYDHNSRHRQSRGRR